MEADLLVVAWTRALLSLPAETGEWFPDEWAAVKAFAKHVEVVDSTHSTLELHATTVAYDAFQCTAAHP